MGYLRGPGFAGVRKVMRETFDDLWIIDLEGDNLGARKSENVFAIQTPVAIAVGVRYDNPHPEIPARAHYTRIEGTQEEKLAKLASISRIEDFQWRDCLNGWLAPILPGGDSDYWNWPLITDLFPWQENGMQFKRTWPIGENVEVLEKRWRTFLNSPERAKLFRESRDRKITQSYPSIDDATVRLKPLINLKPGEPIPTPTRIAYRSFDRQWAMIDNRLGDYLRPTLQSVHNNKQIYITSLLTDVLGKGPAVVATHLIPDMHHFRNRGAKDVIPLWRDAEATDSNIAAGLLEMLAQTYGYNVNPENFFAYCYALLASQEFVNKFWDELTIPGIRVPITKNGALFEEVMSLGRKLLWLHTFGDRFTPPNLKAGKLPPGKVRCKVGTPTNPGDYPQIFSYSYANQELYVGKGVFESVRPQVWEFSVSGFEVVKSWLGYRMLNRAGKHSSPLDSIRPEAWVFDGELLDLLWVLDHTVDLQPEMAKILEIVLTSELFKGSDFPQPTELERKGPKGVASETPLFDFANIEVDAEDDVPYE